MRTSVLFLSLSALVSGAFLQPAGAEKPEPGALPWNLQKLSEPPKHEWLSKEDPIQALSYTGLEFQGKPSSIFAYYASPSTLGGDGTPTGKYPGVVLIHGGGGTAFRAWVELWAKRGYAAIAMDLGGVRPNDDNPKQRTPFPNGGPDQGHLAKFEAIRTDDISDDWPYHAVANCILAHSLLRSFAEVDAERTAVTGISWGGYTTCLVASVDTRFKAAVPVYGCGFLDQNSTWLDEFAKLGPELTRKWVNLYDPSSYLARCTVPIFFVNGTNDFAYPLDSHMKSYDLVTLAPKNLRLQVKMSHGHEPGWAPSEIGRWIDHQLGVKTDAPLLTCEVPVLKGSEVQAKIAGPLAVKSAHLHYALPGEKVNTREWQSVPAVHMEGSVTAPAPPQEADMWFFSVTDGMDGMVTSPVIFR